MSEGASASPGANNTGHAAPGGQTQGAASPAGIGASAPGTATPARGESAKGDGVSITSQSEQPTAQEKMTTETAKQRKKLKDHLATIFPDRQFESDEEAEDEGIRYIDELHNYRQKNVEANQKIMDVFDSEPVLVDVMRDMLSGATLMEAMARHVDIDNIKPQPGDPDHERWTKALSERESKRLEKQKRAKEVDDNIAFTTNELKSFMEDTKMSDDQFKAFADQADKLLQDAYKGRIDKGFFTILYKGLNFDKAIQTAQAQGEIKARNEKIKATIAKEDEGGDGLPGLREGGEMDTGEAKQKTAADVVMADIDKFNIKRKSLADFLKQP